MLIQFTGRELLAFGRASPATCIVRNELNGWRKRDQVVMTMGQTTPPGLAYYPRQFPPGEWEIVREVAMPQDSEYWPVWIDTAARQRLREWETERGEYYRPVMRWFEGRGYGIHHARYEKNGEMVRSNTTLGCINIESPDDARRIGEEIRTAFDMKHQIYIQVPKWNAWKA